MQPEGSPDAIVLQAIEKATLGRRARAKWLALARPEQVTPMGDWEVWLILAGRGWGKTRTGAEDITHFALTNPGVRIALVGPTDDDVRKIMVEGRSGLLNIGDDATRPTYEPSKDLVTWPNGSLAFCYSAEEPERLRGPEHHRAWCDEIGAWGKKAQATWDNLTFGLRLPGVVPQIVATTTPRPTPLIRELRASPATHLTVGRTDDNAANLAPSVLAKWRNKYGGTRLGRQELDGELLEDVPGALWNKAMIDATLMEGPLPGMKRVVIAVDPSGSDGQTGDSQGIVAAGLGYDGRGYVLEDGSDRLSPEGWAQKVVELYDRHRADRVVAERNYGGDMVAAVLRGSAPNLPVTMVTASRGKALRAEPVAALYEQGKISHAEPFPELEDQMGLMTRRGFAGAGSPDRLDALVWAFFDLMLGDEDEEFDIETFIKAYGGDLEAFRAQEAAQAMEATQ